MASLKQIIVSKTKYTAQIFIQALQFEVKGHGSTGMRLAFSENEGEQDDNKRYVIDHSVNSKFQLEFNGALEYSQDAQFPQELMTSTGFKSYIIRYV